MYSKLNVLQPLVKQYMDSGENVKPKEVVAHFRGKGFKRSTIYEVIRRLKLNLPPKNLPGSGAKKKKTTENTVDEIKQMIIDDREVSVRKIASKLNISKSYVSRLMKMSGIQNQRQKCSPHSTDRRRSKKKNAKSAKTEIESNTSPVMNLF